MNRVAVLAALLLLPSTLLASDLDALVGKVINAYGGSAAWAKVTSIRATGRVASPMRGEGKMTRTWSGTDDLRVEINYPEGSEVRVMEHGKGTNNGRASNPTELDAMRMQAARLAIPRLLAEKRGALKDAGTHDNLRSIEIPVTSTLTVTVDIDPATARVVRSTGRSGQMSFSTAYSDFRTVGGLLMAFHEENSAMGMKTADIYLDRVDIK